MNPLLPMDGIEEKMIPHTDLILSRPWNPMERKDLGSRDWVRGEGERELGLELALVRRKELVR